MPAMQLSREKILGKSFSVLEVEAEQRHLFGLCELIIVWRQVAQDAVSSIIFVSSPLHTLCIFPELICIYESCSM